MSAEIEKQQRSAHQTPASVAVGRVIPLQTDQSLRTANNSQCLDLERRARGSAVPDLLLRPLKFQDAQPVSTGRSADPLASRLTEVRAPAEHREAAEEQEKPTTLGARLLKLIPEVLREPLVSLWEAGKELVTRTGQAIVAFVRDPIGQTVAAMRSVWQAAVRGVRAVGNWVERTLGDGGADSNPNLPAGMSGYFVDAIPLQAPPIQYPPAMLALLAAAESARSFEIPNLAIVFEKALDEYAHAVSVEKKLIQEKREEDLVVEQEFKKDRQVIAAALRASINKILSVPGAMPKLAERIYALAPTPEIGCDYRSAPVQALEIEALIDRVVADQLREEQGRLA